MPDGRLVEFTRQERATLLELSRNAGKLVYRDRLHVVIAGPDTTTSPRNVDILVSRLRQKLGDDTRKPRFIATQHREGYVWVAHSTASPPMPGLVGIGRVDGAEHGAAGGKAMIAALGRRLPELAGATVASSALERPPFAIEIAFGPDDDGAICAFALRHEASAEVLATRRERLPAAGADSAWVHAIADWAQEGIWEYVLAPVSRNRPAPADQPLELHIFETAQTLWRPAVATQEMEALLYQARLALPDDPRPAIMWGLAVYGRMVQLPTSDEVLVKASHDAFVAELRQIVERHRAELDGNALLKLGAAKLIWLAAPDQLDLAGQLAEEAYREGTAFAAAHAMRAQIAMYKGEIEASIALFDQAAPMARYGSPFHIYLMAFKCMALAAIADRARLRATMAEMFVARPESREVNQLLLPEEEEDLTPEERMILEAMSAKQFALLLGVLYHTAAKRFSRPEHRANIMRGTVRHARRLHGPDIIDAEIAQLFVPAP
jgi:hypothetical protein